MIFSRKNRKAKGCKYVTNGMLEKINVVYKNGEPITQVLSDDLEETLNIIRALEKERKRNEDRRR